MGRERRDIQAVKSSLYILLLTAAFQGIIAWMGGSTGLLADTIHNLADALTALPLWGAFLLARRPRGLGFPYGYHRAEDVVGLGIVALIAASGLVIGYQSYGRIMNPVFPRYLFWGMFAALIGFGGNEIVALYRIHVGKALGSAALIADGQHARADGLTSLAAFTGLLMTYFGQAWADSAAGLLISLVIVFLAYRTGRDLVIRLMDGVDPALLPHIEHVALRVNGVKGVDAVRARWTGQHLHTELCIAVDPHLTVHKAHAIAEHVRHALLHHIPHLGDALVHVDPLEIPEGSAHALTAHHFSVE